MTVQVRFLVTDEWEEPATKKTVIELPSATRYVVSLSSGFTFHVWSNDQAHFRTV